MPASETGARAVHRTGAKAFLLASAVAQACALLRYVILARILGPEQLGLAATLILTAAFFDLISDTGGERFLIQDPDGDNPLAQRLVQLVLVVRGLVISAALVVGADVIAGFYGAEQLATPLRWLGLSPIILGFAHLDLRRRQRSGDFRAESVSLLVGESAGLVATVAAAYVTRDFTSVLYGQIVRSICVVAVSHLTRLRPYALGLSTEHARRLYAFAAPLMLNGLILFLGTQGDRVIVANSVGLAELGHYSAVLLLIYYPAAMIQRYVHSLFLPDVAAARGNRRLPQVAGGLAGLTFVLAFAMGLGFAFVAPMAVRILYGAAYAQGVFLVALVGVLQTSRFMIVWPTTVALGLGATKTVLAINVARLVAWPVAWLIGHTVAGLQGVVAGFIVGEIVALSVGLVLICRREPSLSRAIARRAALFIASSAAIVGGAYWFAEAPVLVTLGGLVLIGYVAWIERTTLTQLVRLMRKRIDVSR